MMDRILNFPIQLRDVGQLEFEEGVFQNKVKAAQMLNEVAAGTYIMSPGNIEAIKSINEKCRQLGIKPLEF